MQTNRRQFLKTVAGTGALYGISPWQGTAADLIPDATPVRKGKTLVAVFLRGGIDGLNVVVPHGDRYYYEYRSSLAIARPGRRDGAHELDEFFGLHPAASALKPFFDDGSAAALHAVGYAKNTRSHFEEQDTWETGVVGGSLSSDGWLNRHLASSAGHGPVRAVAISDNLPRMLRGDAPAYAIRGVEDLAMPETHTSPDALRNALARAYCTTPADHHCEARALLARTASATLEGTRQLESIARAGYEPANGAEYADNATARRFREAARLIKADIGTEVIQIDHGGWDTHNNQGGLTGGFPNRLRELTEAMAAFATDLGDKLDDVLLVTLSDFGRTVRENGTAGTDHGWANCMLALGGGLARSDKPVRGTWTGLAPEQLERGRDLQHSTDFRDVLADATALHLGNPNSPFLFPGHEVANTGLFKA